MAKGLITELEQAAAEANNLAPFEVSELLDRAADMLRELRKPKPEDPVSHSMIIYLHTVSASAKRRSEDEIVHALLDAAEAIRVLLMRRTSH
ncbi:hypothetical protein NIBR502774_18980 (plasmid) [Rhizobium sp. NIBRBAC000502774]|nr:hypothetical protein NIBR502774_18980 [Rhizobium sp. NIBRBAC000502774]